MANCAYLLPTVAQTLPKVARVRLYRHQCLQRNILQISFCNNFSPLYAAGGNAFGAIFKAACSLCKAVQLMRQWTVVTVSYCRAAVWWIRQSRPHLNYVSLTLYYYESEGGNKTH